MKTLLWLFLIHFSLYADSNISIEKVMIYKTDDPNLTVANIHDKQRYFQPLNIEEKLIDIGNHSWLAIKLNKNLPSGKYLITYIGCYFDLHSFNEHQNFNHYISNKVSVFSFEYTQNSDHSIYYFRLINSFHQEAPCFVFHDYNTYYKDVQMKPDSKEFYLLFGLFIGLILMVTIYNLSIYFFTKEVSFLHYSLMEIFMIVIMSYQLGILNIDRVNFGAVSLASSLFATLFMRSFLDTKKYLPRLHMVLNIYIFLILIDFIHLLINGYSLVSRLGLYSIFGIIYFFIGYLRLKQGFIPARFFLLGWSMLVVSIFMAEHIGDMYGISPFLFGPPLEAILLSLALAHRLKLILNEKKEQQELLVHQSKLAAMGEMIGNIAHQWKQPLNYLSYNFMNLREAQKRDLLDTQYLNKKLDKADAQLQFMSETIDNFRDFYLPNKEKNLFSIEEASRETVEIMAYQFEQHNIEIIINVTEDIKLLSYKNEYKQVLLNLLTNAKDVFLQRNISSAQIIITINKDVVSVLDNAGGIKKEILNRIYEPYFTTKEGNSGIGLYMSKMIVEKDMEGILKVENSEEGALFIIQFNTIKEST